jgi:hypothetical protein
MPIKVFISHGKPDSWIARQLRKEVRDCGATTFLDETDIPKGGNFKEIIKHEIQNSDELLAIFTPWSAQRFWVWSEVGAAWGQDKRVIAVLFGLTVSQLEELGESKAVFEDINILNLNDMDQYLDELRKRVKGLQDG